MSWTKRARKQVADMRKTANTEQGHLTRGEVPKKARAASTREIRRLRREAKRLSKAIKRG